MHPVGIKTHINGHEIISATGTSNKPSVSTESKEYVPEILDEIKRYEYPTTSVVLSSSYGNDKMVAETSSQLASSEVPPDVSAPITLSQSSPQARLNGRSIPEPENRGEVTEQGITSQADIQPATESALRESSAKTEIQTRRQESEKKLRDAAETLRKVVLKQNDEQRSVTGGDSDYENTTIEMIVDAAEKLQSIIAKIRKEHPDSVEHEREWTEVLKRWFKTSSGHAKSATDFITVIIHSRIPCC